ncbi:olfactory receptor 5AR1-like [Rhinoderma darwinii]|uniref:olfactory receptor 5AR1-like n=1 Tax=Rhinoderma darwinii TaxID=43563 RepID=UPI003F66BD22
MGGLNHSSAQVFVLSGLTDNPNLQIILFIFFMVVYIFTVLGNTGIMIITKIDPSLKTPMYFFLHHLSFSDLCYSSVVSPEMLVNFFRKHHFISLVGCAVQMFIFVTFGAMECFLLGIMAYDRYCAICSPLMYHVAMNVQVCTKLVAAAYFGSVANALVHTTGTFSLRFCHSNIIKHFYCDIPPLLNLSCSDTTINEFLLVVFGILTSWFSLLVIIISYGYIISTIIKIRSGQGKLNVFSTCASHFTAVSMFYGALFFMYFRPATSFSEGQDSVASIFYTVIIPGLNPLIYSLRNREVKKAIRKAKERLYWSPYGKM